MTETLDPSAFAAWGDERDDRDGVQEVDADMIYAYVIKETALPGYSARPFAEWLYDNWGEADDGEEQSLLTNQAVIYGAIVDWCGGRTR